MMGRSWASLVACVVCLAGGCEDRAPQPSHSKALAQGAEIGREPLRPLPEPLEIDPALVELGSKLFNDKRLSSDGTIACSSCHDLANGGDDGRARSVGVGGRLTEVNAPSVYNSGLNFAQFWDGRAPTLEAQIDGPVATEMNSNWNDVVSKLRAEPAVVSAFARARQPLSPDGVRTAIAAFERTLLTRGSPFDRWLEGAADALTAEQKAGYETFKSVGCVACHQGANVGGNMFQRFGVMGDYFEDRGQIVRADYGRYNVTHDEADRFVFRVPSLRNVEHTAPYFHDGTAKTLRDAVDVMATYQLGRHIDEVQVSQIVAFLKSLSGPMSGTGAQR